MSKIMTPAAKGFTYEQYMAQGWTDAQLIAAGYMVAPPPDRLDEMQPNLTDAAREKLRLTVERIERLEEEKKEVSDQITDVYAEAKAMGYDTKALRAVVRLRKIDRQEREENEAVLETYMIAMGEI